MKYLFLILTFVTACACSTAELVENPTDVSTQRSPSPKPTPISTPAPEKIDSRLEADLKKIADAAQGRVAVGAVMVETGESAYLDRKGQYPMQSVYKLPIAMTLLAMKENGRLKDLDQHVYVEKENMVRKGLHSPIRDEFPGGVQATIGGLLQYSVSQSDGTASDVLLDLAGGPGAVMNYLKSIGVSDLTIADSEKSISKDWETQYRNWSTPEAAIQLLRALHERRAQLAEDRTQLLLQLMTETETGGRRIKRGLPEGALLAHKTGTGGTEKGITGATNDIGIISLPDGRHILLAVFVADSPADVRTREKVIEEIARTALQRWTQTVRPSKLVGNNIDFNLRHSLN